MKAVKTENLTKYYGKHRGVIRLNLSVEQGDFFGFIGPNGAGKSTTIRLLLGLISPTEGNAEILGKCIKTNSTEVLRDLGYLPSEAFFYKGLRVKELLRLSADLRGLNCEKEAAELCERLDLDPTRKIGELSFGNRKKVGIVCALQHRPELCILDEPTGGLDPLIQREFYKILTERNRQGTTVFLSSHVLSEVERYCRTAAVIREGKLLVCDKVEKLSHTGAKDVTLRGVSDFGALPNATDLRREGDTVRFLYTGGAEALLKDLSALRFHDFTVTDPDLEEVFMHYYEKEEN